MEDGIWGRKAMFTWDLLFFANSSYFWWQCGICLCAVRAFFLPQLASFVINGIVLNLLRFWILFVIKNPINPLYNVIISFWCYSLCCEWSFLFLPCCAHMRCYHLWESMFLFLFFRFSHSNFQNKSSLQPEWYWNGWLVLRVS